MNEDFLMAQKWKQSLQIFFDFTKSEIVPNIERKLKQKVESNKFSQADEFIYKLFFRVCSHLETLNKLDKYTHFQTCFFISRSLFEIAIDCALIKDDFGKIENILAWNESVMLNVAEKLEKYYKEKYLEKCEEKVLEQDKPILDFLKDINRIEEIKEKRDKFFNTKKHPISNKRWTNKFLWEDAIDASKIDVLNTIDKKYDFEYFHKTAYVRSCWFIHGSGTVGICDDVGSYHRYFSLTFMECCNFMLIITSFVLEYFKLSKDINLDKLYTALIHLHEL